MYLSKKIFLFIIILSSIFSCSGSPNPSQEQIDLLKVSVELFLNDKEVVFNKTFDKDLVKNVLNVPFSNDLLTRNPLASDTNIDSLFDVQTLKKLNRAFKDYQSLILDSLNVELGELVKDEQIPDYVRDQRPTSNWEVDFNSVLYLSTPIVSDNRAILLTDSSGDVMIGINFFIKKEGEWILVGSTF